MGVRAKRERFLLESNKESMELMAGAKIRVPYECGYENGEPAEDVLLGEGVDRGSG